MPEFADYQRWMWRVLSYFSVCPFYIEKDHNGKYSIKQSGTIRKCFYYMMWLNSLVKVFYLVLAYQGWLVEVHFLDQMSMWDWFLCCAELIQETNIWYRKKLYETLHANWTVQEEVFRKLGSPKTVDDKITKTCKYLMYMHSIIIFVGCISLMVQYFAAPKYAVNTYAIFPYDNIVFEIAFAAHEYFFMLHIWMHAAFSIVLLEVFAVSYTPIVEEMTRVLRNLVDESELKFKPTDGLIIGGRGGSRTSLSKDREKRRRKNSSGSGSLQESSNKTSSHIDQFNSIQFIPDRILDPIAIAKNTEYDIYELLSDYRKVMMASREFNNWSGRLMGGVTLALYSQFVSDVFMMIQLLKEPETDFLGVFFFFEDASAGMAMLFPMLILLSKLFTASSQFLDAFKEYLQHDTPNKKYLRKYQRNLRIVAAKIGGYSTNPSTVPKGINALMNYYIGAAMYQRPKDRRT